MSATSKAREDRIELRAAKEEKRLLAAAAAHERLDVTSFIMRNVLLAPREVLDRAERIVLSEREPIGRNHDRKRFDCGSPDLQNHESGGAKTFVAVPLTDPARVLGFYSISPVPSSSHECRRS